MVDDGRDACVFCAIGQGDLDDDLVAYRDGVLFVLPTLTQRSHNPGQIMVIPRRHVRHLAGADSQLLLDLYTMVQRLTVLLPKLYNAVGTETFNSNGTPDQSIEHLHVHLVPRHRGDGYISPNPNRAPAPRELRFNIARRIADALATPPTV